MDLCVKKNTKHDACVCVCVCMCVRERVCLPLFPNESLGAFDFKRRCTERSVYDIKIPREPFESIGSICSLIALAVL